MIKRSDLAKEREIPYITGMEAMVGITIYVLLLPLAFLLTLIFPQELVGALLIVAAGFLAYIALDIWIIRALALWLCAGLMCVMFWPGPVAATFMFIPFFILLGGLFYARVIEAMNIVNSREYIEPSDRRYKRAHLTPVTYKNDKVLVRKPKKREYLYRIIWLIIAGTPMILLMNKVDACKQINTCKTVIFNLNRPELALIVILVISLALSWIYGLRTGRYSGGIHY